MEAPPKTLCTNSRTQDNLYTTKQKGASREENSRGKMDPNTNPNPSYRVRGSEHPYSYPFYELDLPRPPRVNGQARQAQLDESSSRFPANPYASMEAIYYNQPSGKSRPDQNPKKSNKHVKTVVVAVVLSVAVLGSLVSITMAALSLVDNQRLNTRLEQMEAASPSAGGSTGMNCREDSVVCRAGPLTPGSIRFRQPCNTLPLPLDVTGYFTTGIRCEYESAKVGTVETGTLLRIGDQVRCQCDVYDIDETTGSHEQLSFGVSMVCRLLVSRCRIN